MVFSNLKCASESKSSSFKAHSVFAQAEVKTNIVMISDTLKMLHPFCDKIFQSDVLN